MAARSDPPIRGTCFGYEVRSELEFAFLRSGSGDPLEITADGADEGEIGEPVHEWRPPRSPTHVRLYADHPGYRLWIEGAGWFGVESAASRLVVPTGGDPIRTEERLWGLPMVLSFLARGDLPLHAAAVEIGRKALLLAGPGRFGKTTLAAAFAASGYRMLSEDVVCIRPAARPAVIPGPAMLRLRLDVAGELRIPGAVRVRRDDERIHLSLEEKRGSCEPVPLAGIVFLQEANVAPSVEETGRATAVRDLWALSFNLPTNEDRRRSFHGVADLASRVPTWRLRRRLEIEDLQPTVDLLVKTVAGRE